MNVINPGTLPVEGASLQAADANMAAFAAAVRERGGALTGGPNREPAADGDGRYGYLLPAAGERVVRVRMPGVDLAKVRDDLSATAPCVLVNGHAWWWNDAVGQAVHATTAA